MAVCLLCRSGISKHVLALTATIVVIRFISRLNRSYLERNVCLAIKILQMFGLK